MNKKNKANWKAKVETGFESLGLVMGRRPWLWLLSCLAAVGVMASQLGRLEKDTSIEGFLEKGSVEIQRYDAFKETFGRDEVFIITMEVEDIFTQTFATQLHALHRQLEDEVPHVNKVDSLVNARYTHGADDTLYIEELLPETLPGDPVELEKLKRYTYNSDNYKNFLISADGHMVAMLVRLNSFNFTKDKNGDWHRGYMGEDETREADAKIREILAPYRGVISDDIRLTGSMPIAIMLSQILERDFSVFSGLANLLIGMVLFMIFRRLSGVFMPLLIMTLGVVVTMSLMAILGSPIQVSTSILPAFLLAVCVGDSIHLLTIFYRNYDAGDEKHHAMASAMGHTGLAMLFTSVTTAAGLASFATSDLTPVSALGIYGALGSLIAFLLTIFILPCLIAILPVKRRPLQQDENKGLQPMLAWFARISTQYPKIIVVSGVVLFVAATAVASQIKFSHYPLAWLPEDNETLQGIKNYEQRMGSTISFEILLDTGKDRGVINAPLLQALDKIQQDVVTWESPDWRIVKAISVVNVIKESNRALHDNDEAQFAVPDDPALISQELFLVELDEPDDILNLVDKTYQTARLTVTTPWFDAIHTKELVDRLRDHLNANLQPYGVDVSFTGVAPIMGVTFGKMLISTAESYGFAAIIITLMMVMLIGNLKLGLLSMIPSLLPILIVLAILQLLDVRLDMLTMLVGSIAIGLTVDDNIHFMHGFRKLYLKTGDPAYAVEKTLLSTGRAMLITSIVLSIGFSIYTQSLMSNMIIFGLITAGCIVLALLATYLLAPALMVLANKQYHQQHPHKSVAEMKPDAAPVQ
ncbi:MAG: MMPL family transporter [Ketobacter sp.]|nr:MMPL family transporter [Ketobacter sp.]